MLTLLHLSDLHITTDDAGSKFDRDLKIRQALLDDLGTEGRTEFDAILVTGDSVNMVGEAAATGAPVYLFEPSTGSAKTSRFLSALKELGVARSFNGKIDRFSYAPIDSSLTIALEIARRFATSKAARISGVILRTS